MINDKTGHLYFLRIFNNTLAKGYIKFTLPKTLFLILIPIVIFELCILTIVNNTCSALSTIFELRILS